MSKIIALSILLILVIGCSETNFYPVDSPDKDVIVPYSLSIEAQLSNSNPPVLHISINIPSPRPIDYDINIRNATGYIVKSFHDNGNGIETVDWDLITENGKRVQPGLYVAELAVINMGNRLTRNTAVYID